MADAADLQGEGDGGSQACMWWLMLLICNGKEGWREPSLHVVAHAADL